MTGPTRAKVLAALADPARPPHPGDQDIRQALEAAGAGDCEPQWQPRPTRTTTLLDLAHYEGTQVTDDQDGPS